RINTTIESDKTLTSIIVLYSHVLHHTSFFFFTPSLPPFQQHIVAAPSLPFSATAAVSVAVFSLLVSSQPLSNRNKKSFDGEIEYMGNVGAISIPPPGILRVTTV
uniref:Uncharacterized protein n=1 Tax=Cucumis melo TaxID=3656 RepID=A0A9I9EA97_CUCME